jgi:hypothetical protein
MPSRLAFMLLALVVAALVCASSIWLLPVGQGPFSAVHGPTSYLQAQRVAARVFSGIRLMLVTALLTASANAFSIGCGAFVGDSSRPPSDRRSMICILTC